MSPSKKLVRPRSSAYPEDDGPRQDPIPTPRKAMRRDQDYRFHSAETNPSIRKRVSFCDPSKDQAIACSDNSLAADGCRRPFDMNQDDVLLLWQQSPHKDTLGFYGVGSPSRQPESVLFYQAVMASLEKASTIDTKRRSKRTTSPPPTKKTPILGKFDHQMYQPFILNRQALQTEEQQEMPVDQPQLSPRSVYEPVFCTHLIDPYDPLGGAELEDMMVSRV